MKKTFHSLFPQEKRIIGEWISSSSCVVAELSAAAGFDFLIIDNEHAGWGGDDNISLVRAADACGVAAIIRVTELSETALKQAFDLGATGVMIPGIMSVEDAKKAVQCAKFAPEGRRGACPYTRANSYAVNELTAYYDKANRELTSIILLIEGVEAVEHIDEIVAIPGIHSVAVGPVDLSLSMGIPGDVTNPRIDEAIDKVIAASKKYGVYYLAQCTSEEEARKWFERGADYVMMSDIMLLADAAKAALTAVRNA